MYERAGIGSLTVSQGRLPSGRAGTRRTLELMKRLAIEGSKDVEIRAAAIEAIRQAGIRSHDYLGQLGALFRFVRDQITFVGDIRGVETLQGPRATLQLKGGDCDDRAILLAAMARSIGLPADIRFRVIGANPRHPQAFTHVYVVATLGGRQIPMDPTYPDNRMGWQYPSPSVVGDFRV